MVLCRLWLLVCPLSALFPCPRRRRKEGKVCQRRAAIGRREPGRARDRGLLSKEQASQADGADREERVGDAGSLCVCEA